jgi:hypothetical protein
MYSILQVLWPGINLAVPPIFALGQDKPLQFFLEAPNLASMAADMKFSCGDIYFILNFFFISGIISMAATRPASTISALLLKSIKPKSLILGLITICAYGR